MSLLERIMRRNVEPVKANPPLMHELELVGEFPCGDDRSVVVRGYDSSMEMSGGRHFIRRYPVLLKFNSVEKAQEFAATFGGDPKSIHSEGSILFDNIPGETYMAGQQLGAMRERFLETYNIALPTDAIMQAIQEDVTKAIARGVKYLEPVEQKRSANAR